MTEALRTHEKVVSAMGQAWLDQWRRENLQARLVPERICIRVIIVESWYPEPVDLSDLVYDPISESFQAAA